MHIVIDTRTFEAEAKRACAALSPHAFRRAGDRAIRKTLTVVEREVKRIGAKRLGITQKAFGAARVTVRRPREGEDSAMVWVGTNPYPVHRLGRVIWRRRAEGARVGRRRYPGAFAWGKNANRPLVWRRAGRQRLPIEVVTEEIHAGIDADIKRIEVAAVMRYRRLLAQELNYELQKVVKRGAK
jgi:hypothetical protein